MEDEEVKAALRRRALGFETDEIVEEYAFQEGEAVLLKRKVTKKTVPPDMTAAKMLLEGEMPAASLSDEQLAAEKTALYSQLAEVNRQLRAERRKLAMCRAIRAQAPQMAQDIQKIQRKEVIRDEHRR